MQKPAPHERPLCMSIYIYILFIYYIHIICHIFINSIPPFSVVVIPTSAFFAFSSPAGPSGRQMRSVSSHKRCEKGASAVAAGRVLVVAICCTMSKSFSSDFLQCVSRDMEVAKQMRQPKCDAWCSSFTRKGACEWCHIRENIG